MELKMMGVCHICGIEGKLTFEHIPPKRAFNSNPVAIQTIWGRKLQYEYGLPEAPAQRFGRGMGKRSLCQKCNEWTASEYGEAFAQWSVQALRYLDRAGPDGQLLLPFEIEPLRVIKQIIVMCLATAEYQDPLLHSTLRNLVLCPYERHIPPCYRFHIYFNPCSPDESRMVTNAAMVRLGEGIKFYSLAEVAFPPMGYSLTLVQGNMGCYASDEGLCYINHFAEFRLGERAVRWLGIPVKRPSGPAPLNFRN
jgi:hypothetical protein